MTRPSHDDTARSSLWWCHLYRTMLALYPQSHRRAFGRDMEECFADLACRARREEGQLGEAAFAMRSFLELPRSAFKARRRSAGVPTPSHGHSQRYPTDTQDSKQPSMETFIHDVRFALRGFRKNPGFAALAILSLALGIGANTTMFSTVNALLWQDLPVPQPERLVRIFEWRDSYRNVSYPNFRDLREQSDVFDGVLLHRLETFGLNTGEESQVLTGEIVTANYFQVLGIEPALGRFFTAPESDNATAEPVAVISHALWERSFGADPGVVGRVVQFNNHPVTIVGVAPAGFNGTKFALGMDAWIPVKIWGRLLEWGDWTESRGSAMMRALARLKDGVDIEQAQQAATMIAARLAEQYPETNRGRRFTVFPEQVVTPEGAGLVPLIGLLAIGASALVLLVACANVASLLFARSVARRREIGVRLALGASRTRLVRQLLTESLLLSAAGGMLGIATSYWTTGFVFLFLPSLPYRFVIEPAPDGTVLAIAATISTTAALVFGLAPALQASKPDITSVIKSESTTAGHRVSKGRMFDGVVVSMVAMSFVTLMLSALFTKSLGNVRDMDPGFATSGRVLATLDASLAGYTAVDGLPFLQELETRVRTLPGVENAALATLVPLGDRSSSSRVFADDRTYEADDPGAVAWRNSVTPEYFRTMDTRILSGRTFDERDHIDAPRRVIINEALARRFWPDEDAIGRRIRNRRNPTETTLEVIGVVETGRYMGMGEGPRPAMFTPLAQAPSTYINLIVHSASDPLNTIAAIRSEARAINAAIPIFDVKTIETHLAGSMWMYRLGAGIGSALGMLALALAAGGLYGIMAFSVGQRSRELGIRIALGASRRRVMRLVLKRGLTLTGMGIAIGSVMALGASGVLSTVLFGVAPTDPAIFVAVAAGLGGVALLASIVPARTATKADPVEVLRGE